MPGTLDDHHVGRVAYCDDLGPVALPVNYARDQGAILIQTSPHSTLASRLRAAPASFQIDEFDEYTQTGWNVLVRVTPTQHLGPPTPARLIPPASDLRLA